MYGCSSVEKKDDDASAQDDTETPVLPYQKPNYMNASIGDILDNPNRFLGEKVVVWGRMSKYVQTQYEKFRYKIDDRRYRSLLIEPLNITPEILGKLVLVRGTVKPIAVCRCQYQETFYDNTLSGWKDEIGSDLLKKSCERPQIVKKDLLNRNIIEEYRCRPDSIKNIPYVEELEETEIVGIIEDD